MDHLSLRTETFEVSTHDGWTLELRRTTVPGVMRTEAPPLLIVPGYGMNSHIFAFHPGGRSMKRSLAEAGHEVWSINMRHQGASARERPKAPVASLKIYATVDLPAAIGAVLSNTATVAEQLVLIGVSLGGAVSYSYLALHHDAPVAAMVAMSSPLRWNRVHPVVRTAFASRRIAGALPVAGARRAARFALPTLGRFTPLLSPYVNVRRLDLAHVREMVKSVEDPPRNLNREMAHWLKRRRLVVDGVDVADALQRWDIPLLVVVANRDGIVPECAVLSVLDFWGGTDREVLRVGDHRNWYAHADPYIAPDAHERVFRPMARWLKEREGSGSGREAPLDDVG